LIELDGDGDGDGDDDDDDDDNGSRMVDDGWWMIDGG